MGDDSGWKQVHGDVFRKPAHLDLYAAMLGSGTQLIMLAMVVIAAAFAGSLYVDRGAVTKAVVVGYALTSVVAGFVSGRYYRSQFAPEPSPAWIRVMLISSSLLPALVLATALALNCVAMAYGTTNALSMWTLLRMALIWAFVSLPLAVFGTIGGRRFAKPAAPMRVNPMSRPVPARPWFASTWFVCLVAGILPFGSIFIETYFVFTSFWNYKFYYVYGFMMAVFVILAIVVSCVSVVTTYFLLNSEGAWLWWWWIVACARTITVGARALSLSHPHPNTGNAHTPSPRRSPLAVDGLLRGCVRCTLRLPLRRLLLRLQDRVSAVWGWSGLSLASRAALQRALTGPHIVSICCHHLHP